MKKTIFKTVNIQDDANEVMISIEQEVSKHTRLERLRKNGWKVSRRGFLKTIGAGGILISLIKTPLSLLGQNRSGQRLTSEHITPYLKLETNGTVTAFTPKIEYGQGIRTGFVQIVAEELNLDADKVNVVMGDTSQVPYESGGTWGSQSTISMYPQLRRAAAIAKDLLVNMAGSKLEISPGNISISNGEIYETNNKNNKTTFAELVAEGINSSRISTNPAYKPSNNYQTVGKNQQKVDNVEKVTGERKFASDIILDNMLYGAVLRNNPPGVVTRFDDNRARNVKGVEQVLRTPRFVIILAKRSDIARKAITDQVGEQYPGPQQQHTRLKSILRSSLRGARTAQQSGDISRGRSESDKTIDSIYYMPYVAHAPIETEAATAIWEGDRVTVWAGTQAPFRSRMNISRSLRIPEQNITVKVPDLGGGFGGKGSISVDVEAVYAAQQSGRPVKIVWSREEEFAYMYFRAARLIRIRAGVKNDGTITFWDYSVTGGHRRGGEFPYRCDNIRFSAANSDGLMRIGAWRGVEGPPNNYAKECALDELAHEIGMDPAEFRLMNLTDNTLKKTCEEAMSKFGWKKAKSPTKKGVGIALGQDVGSYIAECVKLDVETGGRIKVKKITAAMDSGLVINPDIVKLQIEGGIIMGLSTALHEEMKFGNNQLQDVNFNTYKIAGFSDMPEIESHMVDSDRNTPQGVGEVSIFPIAPAIANAYFDATGERLRDLPLKHS